MRAQGIPAGGHASLQRVEWLDYVDGAVRPKTALQHVLEPRLWNIPGIELGNPLEPPSMPTPQPPAAAPAWKAY
jgi:hypothetical protein